MSSTNPLTGDLFDIYGLMAYLGTTKRAIYQQRHRGEGPPACIVGRELRWRRQDVEAWLASKVESVA